MIRRFLTTVPLAMAAIAGTFLTTSETKAQNQAILAEVYGRGVHAFYAGQANEAYQFLSSAINGGTRDPRAYYFRGIVANQQGRPYEAEADWAEGARLEATMGGVADIGRSLTRFQGSARLKLEQIRQKARLDAMMNANSRSDARLNELGASRPAAPPVAPGTAPTPAPPAPPAAAANDPFIDDGLGIAGGQPKVDSNNALDGLDDPLPTAPDAATPEPAADPAMDAGGNPFDAPAADAPGGNPFDAPAADSNPFDAPAGESNPFGEAPF